MKKRSKWPRRLTAAGALFGLVASGLALTSPSSVAQVADNNGRQYRVLVFTKSAGGQHPATAAGVGYFITTRTRFTDQNGEEVGWETFRVLKFIPSQPRPAASDGAAAAAPKPGRIKPPMGHDNAWWWETVAKGTIPIQRCKSCGVLRHPPRPMCGQCGSMEWDHVAASGRGTLHTFTVIRYPQFPGYDSPIVAALVDLEEGTRLMSSIVGCEPSAVKIGMRLVGEIHRDDDGFALPVFRPAK